MDRRPIVQGDVMLFPIDAIPAGAKQVERERHTLALGESTGHAHVLEWADLYEIDGERMVEIAERHIAQGAALHHEDHGPVPVAPAQVGAYRVIQQVEPDILGGFRAVAD